LGVPKDEGTRIKDKKEKTVLVFVTRDRARTGQTVCTFVTLPVPFIPRELARFDNCQNVKIWGRESSVFWSFFEV